MKTTLDLPDELMKEAMQLTDIKTKTEVIKLALQELIKKSCRTKDISRQS